MSTLNRYMGHVPIGTVDGKPVMGSKALIDHLSQQYTRTGGNEAPTIPELDDEWKTVGVFDSPSHAVLASLSNEVQALRREIALLPDYRAEIAELRKQLRSLSTQEAFA